MDAALNSIATLFGKSFSTIEPHLQTALASAADPERSLVYLERLLESRDESLLHDLVKNPRVIESLVTIFSGSQFLTAILLRNPKNVHLLYHRKSLTQRKHARIWKHGNTQAERLKRDENRSIRKQCRKDWKKNSGYHTRSLAETSMFRLKAIFGDMLSAHLLETQTTQALVRCAALNKMTHLGMPQSYKAP